MHSSKFNTAVILSVLTLVYFANIHSQLGNLIIRVKLIPVLIGIKSYFMYHPL
jgi:hypothetical protein